MIQPSKPPSPGSQFKGRQDRRTRRALPGLKFFGGLCLQILTIYHACIYFNCSQQTMFTICILLTCTTLTTKTQGMFERASKQSQTPGILPRRYRAPGFEIPGSATAIFNHSLFIDISFCSLSKCVQFSVDFVWKKVKINISFPQREMKKAMRDCIGEAGVLSFSELMLITSV